MDFPAINMIAVVVAAVATFAFGAIYYTVLGKAWMEAVGTTEEEIKKTRSAVPFVTSFVSLLVMASVLSAFLAQQREGVASPSEAAATAVVLWLGLIVTSLATNNAFQGNKLKLTILDSIHWLGVLVIQGQVIRAFG